MTQQRIDFELWLSWTMALLKGPCALSIAELHEAYLRGARPIDYLHWSVKC